MDQPDTCSHRNNQFGRCEQGSACQCAADEARDADASATGSEGGKAPRAGRAANDKKPGPRNLLEWCRVHYLTYGRIRAYQLAEDAGMPTRSVSGYLRGFVGEGLLAKDEATAHGTKIETRYVMTQKGLDATNFPHLIGVTPDCGVESTGTQIFIDCGAGDVRCVESAYCPDCAERHDDR